MEQTFPYISFEELRAVPLAIMKKMPEVPPRFLRRLSENVLLYKVCQYSVSFQTSMVLRGQGNIPYVWYLLMAYSRVQ